MGIFTKKRKKDVELPALLMPQDAVNYNSVLDYLVGLSRSDYDRMLKVAAVYREANKSACKILGLKEEPSTVLQPEQPSDADIDDALDSALQNIPVEFEDIEPTTKKNTTPKEK